MPTKRWKRTEYAEMWQWNGPDDNREGPTIIQAMDGQRRGRWYLWGKEKTCLWLKRGDYIIKRGDTYEVITNAEFEAQGWEE